MSKKFTDSEWDAIREELEDAEEDEQITITSSKSSFLSWLEETSLGHLVGKLIDMAWGAIMRLFGL
ncbi:MAG: hypothetical protein LCH89_17530 [Proteobacteria bacterium]|nr:hypothetical protein [Pseudomonadota bacterium]